MKKTTIFAVTAALLLSGGVFVKTTQNQMSRVFDANTEALTDPGDGAWDVIDGVVRYEFFQYSWHYTYWEVHSFHSEKINGKEYRVEEISYSRTCGESAQSSDYCSVPGQMESGSKTVYTPKD